jgi:hypothetical protein
LNKLRKCNFDPELLNVLSVPTRAGNEVKGEYIRLPNGDIKRDKNGRAIRKRPPPKPKIEVKDEEIEPKPSPKKKKSPKADEGPDS